MSKNNYHGIDTYILKQVRYHARSAIRHSALRTMDVEDIEQELILDVLSRIHAHDPERASWHTFVNCILMHKIATLIAEAKAQKRGRGLQSISLDAMLENTNGEDDTFPDPAGNPERGMHLAIDLHLVMQTLPQPLVLLIWQLGTYNPSELSRMTGVPRATLYRSINVLRKTLRQYGMHHYLR
jgi:DNA-directed RNA polymerase specialized sigma24 family protein